MTPGQLIKKHRERLGLTQLELSKQLGYEIPQFVSLVENGRSKIPIGTCSRLIELLKIDRDALIGSLVEEYKQSISKSIN